MPDIASGPESGALRYRAFISVNGDMAGAHAAYQAAYEIYVDLAKRAPANRNYDGWIGYLEGKLAATAPRQ